MFVALAGMQHQFVLHRPPAIDAIPHEAAEGREVRFDLIERNNDGSAQLVVQSLVIDGRVKPSLARKAKQNGMVSLREERSGGRNHENAFRRPLARSRCKSVVGMG